MESHEDDPRGKDVGQGGYPEEQHPGAEPAEGTRKRDPDDSDAPGTTSENEGGPQEATGNPGAAGG
jgi:hypothetical protein